METATNLTKDEISCNNPRWGCTETRTARVSPLPGVQDDNSKLTGRLPNPNRDSVFFTTSCANPSKAPHGSDLSTFLPNKPFNASSKGPMWANPNFLELNWSPQCTLPFLFGSRKRPNLKRMSVSAMYVKTQFSICDVGAIRSSRVRLEKDKLLSFWVEGVDATMITLRLNFDAQMMFMDSFSRRSVLIFRVAEEHTICSLCCEWSSELNWTRGKEEFVHLMNLIDDLYLIICQPSHRISGFGFCSWWDCWVLVSLFIGPTDEKLATWPARENDCICKNIHLLKPFQGHKCSARERRIACYGWIALRLDDRPVAMKLVIVVLVLRYVGFMFITLVNCTVVFHSISYLASNMGLHNLTILSWEEI